MLNYSFVKKNETKPYNMGNMENSSNLATACCRHELHPQCSTNVHIHHW